MHWHDWTRYSSSVIQTGGPLTRNPTNATQEAVVGAATSNILLLHNPGSMTCRPRPVSPSERA
jgi:hypothetical protein